MICEERIDSALELIFRFGSVDGDHHKQWVLDQIVRRLTGTEEAYRRWVAIHNDGEDGPNTYNWEEGIAP